MLAAKIDTVVLGCTHYPFVIPQIKQIVGEGVRVIDPAPAVARQVGRLLDQFDLHTPEDAPGEITLLTTGEVEKFRHFAESLGIFEGDVNIDQLVWSEAG